MLGMMNMELRGNKIWFHRWTLWSWMIMIVALSEKMEGKECHAYLGALRQAFSL